MEAFDHGIVVAAHRAGCSQRHSQQQGDESLHMSKDKQNTQWLMKMTIFACFT